MTTFLEEKKHKDKLMDAFANRILAELDYHNLTIPKGNELSLIDVIHHLEYKRLIKLEKEREPKAQTKLDKILADAKKRSETLNEENGEG